MDNSIEIIQPHKRNQRYKSTVGNLYLYFKNMNFNNYRIQFSKSKSSLENKSLLLVTNICASIVNEYQVTSRD